MASATRPWGPRSGHLPINTNNPRRARPEVSRFPASADGPASFPPAPSKVSTQEAQRGHRHQAGSRGCSRDAAADSVPPSCA